MHYEVFFKAFIMGLGLIVAIGAQNIFIIKTGLQHKNVFLAASVAAACDTILIALGTFFMAGLMHEIPSLIVITKWAGCIFLLYYGTLSMLNAIRKAPRGWAQSDAELQQKLQKLKPGRGSAIVWPTLAFSLLNPHVYLDTFLVLGNLGSRMPSAVRWEFVAGAGSASFFWFYLTGFSARATARAFARPAVSRGFDAIVGVAMFGIAYGLYVAPI